MEVFSADIVQYPLFVGSDVLLKIPSTQLEKATIDIENLKNCLESDKAIYSDCMNKVLKLQNEINHNINFNLDMFNRIHENNNEIKSNLSNLKNFIEANSNSNSNNSDKLFSMISCLKDFTSVIANDALQSKTEFKTTIKRIEQLEQEIHNVTSNDTSLILENMKKRLATIESRVEPDTDIIYAKQEDLECINFDTDIKIARLRQELENLIQLIRNQLEAHSIRIRLLEDSIAELKHVFTTSDLHQDNKIMIIQERLEKLEKTSTSSVYANYPAMVDGPMMVFCDKNGQLGTNTSSERYKENISNIGNFSSIIHKLRPVSFTYKSDKSKKIQYGLIGEEVERVFPEIVCFNEKDEIVGISYHNLIPLLLNEVKTIKKDIDMIKK